MLPPVDSPEAKTPRDELHAAIMYDIRQRSSWETKQVNYYKMRHQGLARRSKPWPNAADLHFPLIDTNIEKLKPLFFQQIVGMDVVASFVPMIPQMAGPTTTAEQWFDYKMRERTNLQDESLSWIDWALMSGRGLIKIYWDPKKNQVAFSAIDPMFVIIPAHTKDIQDADRVVHVMPMSVAAYKRDGRYTKTDKETIERLTGDGTDPNDPGTTNQDNTKRLREGITHETKRDKIIVWEVYERGEDGGWVIHTFSPQAPDINLRDPMLLPYEHGMVPFVDFPYEIKDKGWYSPRGIAEILAPFEAALCHTWNQKHDSMQLFNKPVYRAEREVPNSMNLRVGPGQILPYGIAPVANPQPPISFDQEMTTMRSIAEQRVSNPDYGMGQVLDTTNRRTATEIQAIGAQTQQAGDLRARTFRMALAKVYKMSWSLLIQYDSQDLNYRFLANSQQVDAQALHEKYHIEPKGGVNEVNKEAIARRYATYKNLFQNSPWIDQSVIDRQMLALLDPEMVTSAFKDPNTKQQDEQVDEMKNIPALLIGAPIPVEKGQNYSLRIGVLMQYLQNARQTGQQLPPAGVQKIVGRLEALLQADATVDNNGAKQLGKTVQEFLQSAGMLPAQPTGLQQ